jgi:hypothetical protein
MMLVVGFRRAKFHMPPKNTPPKARTTLAKQIINAAKAGERDPRWLVDRALLYLSQQKLTRKPEALS